MDALSSAGELDRASGAYACARDVEGQLIAIERVLTRARARGTSPELDDRTMRTAWAAYELGVRSVGDRLADAVAESAPGGLVRSQGRMLRAFYEAPPEARRAWERDAPRALSALGMLAPGAPMPAALILRCALELKHGWLEQKTTLGASSNVDLDAPVFALTLAGRTDDALTFATVGRVRAGAALDRLVSALLDEGRVALALRTARRRVLEDATMTELAVHAVDAGLPLEVLEAWEGGAAHELATLVVTHRLVERGRKAEARKLLGAWGKWITDPDDAALLASRSELLPAAAVRWAITVPRLGRAARSAIERLLARVSAPLPETGAAATLAAAIRAQVRGDLDLAVSLATDAAERDGAHGAAADALAWMGYPERAAALSRLAPEAARAACLSAAARSYVALRETDLAIALFAELPEDDPLTWRLAAITSRAMVGDVPELAPAPWWPRGPRARQPDESFRATASDGTPSSASANRSALAER